MVFDVNDIRRMQVAFAAAERALVFAHPLGLDRTTRNQLAKEIVRAAVEGEQNPILLCAAALGSIDPKPAAWTPSAEMSGTKVSPPL